MRVDGGSDGPMAKSIFEHVSDGLEQRSDLAKLEARGTVRLALKQAGLDVGSVTAGQMLVVLAQVLPAELKVRGVEQSERVCEILQIALKAAHPSDAAAETVDAESPEAIFRRIGRG